MVGCERKVDSRSGNSTFNKHDHVCLQAEFEWTSQNHDSDSSLTILSCSHFSCPLLIPTLATNGRLPTCTQLLPSSGQSVRSQLATCPILCLDLHRLRVIMGHYNPYGILSCNLSLQLIVRHSEPIATHCQYSQYLYP